MSETYKKIDDNTIEITETFEIPPPNVTVRDRAELQTELDHLPDRRAELQAQLDKVDAQEAKLKKILKVFID